MICKSFVSLLLIIISITIFLSTGWAASGDVDAGFNTSVFQHPAGLVNAVARQPDGKLLIGGNGFEIANGRLRKSLVRMNADGTFDTSFNATGLFNTPGVSKEVLAIGVQSDGKIIVSNYTFIYRLNQDGSVDNTFNLPVLTNTFSGFISTIHVLPDDKILIGGSFFYSPASGSARRRNITRLNSNGVTDETFNAGEGYLPVYDIEIQPDGKILGASVSASSNNVFLKRLNQDGTVDDSLTTLVTSSNGFPTEYEIQADGKILIGGNFQNVNNIPRNNLARINPDGSLDETFTGSSFNTINDVELDTNGKIYINGNYFTPGGNRFNIARLNQDGSLDLSFEFVLPVSGPLTVNDILLVPGGDVIVGGTGYRAGTFGGLVFRMNSSGGVDSSFNFLSGNRGSVWEIVPQTDGKILVAGQFSIVNSAFKTSFVRLNTDGTIDTSFNPPDLSPGFAPIVRAIAVQTDGKIIIGGQFAGMIVRLNPDGSRDNGFSVNLDSSGPVYDLKVLPDGKILAVGDIMISGESSRRYIARFNSNGSLDTTLQQAFPNGSVFRVILQPDGKPIICGNFGSVGGILRGRVARLNTDGSVDTSFNPLGGASSIVYETGLQSDGKLIIAGTFTSVNGTAKNYIARMNPNGTLDNSFTVNLDATMSTVRVQSDDRILLGGSFNNVNGNPTRGIARLKADGSFDPTFNSSPGIDGVGLVFEPTSDGKILVGGTFTLYKNAEKLSIMRLLNDSPATRPAFDFDGDGKSDVSVFRSSTNRWYEFLSGNSSVFETTFGNANDIVAPADFDGDGKTDIAIFRPATGDWWYLSSVTNAQVNVHFGASGDIPRPSDFDGDGKADFIVFRPSNSVWYRLGSTGAVSINAFGTAGDKPLVGDFDGDGKSDLAIYRPSTGDWWYQSSINNAQIATHWGISTDIPVPADYDGDGKTDLAVYRPSTGVWYILNSSTGGATIVGFGLAEDKPVAADYDGDGKADIAVFRPSTGVWYLLKSTEGFGALTFGISTDTPVPNAFVP